MIEESNSKETISDSSITKSKKKSKVFLYGVLSGIWISIMLYAVGSLVGWAVGNYRATTTQTSANGSSDVEVVNTHTTQKMKAIEDVLKTYYLEDIDAQDLEKGIYSGMVESLGDPYSTYYSVKELEQMEQDVEGIYFGIGAYVGTDSATGLPLITGVIDGAPAMEADLRDGDLIYMVDGVEVQGMGTDAVVKLIRGEENTSVHLTLVRSGADDFIEVDVTRREVESPTVKYEMLENDIGYIQITEFDRVTMDQFTEALAVCKGSDMKGLILDLRSNPGGSLSVVCEIARKLLPEGLIVYTEDKYGQREEFTCDGANEINVPMVVLVNDYSASASEILAGAIRDHNKGYLMGTCTFGKGIVQRIITLSDGSAVKLTISSYYTPNGNDIHGVGIEPDEVVEFDADMYYNDGVDNQLVAAREYLQKIIK